MIEALSCGVPVVGFNVGGIPDLVQPGQTGLLAKAGDVQDLGVKISGLLRDTASLKHMAEECRKVALEEYALRVQANSYLQLYKSLVATR